ncbi:hypothetical protein LZ31DRAFT_103351 [Colletotrichum somersetense]|nr:hypothetical protein LZ31DRAFT_103351 [Colletotrichum somersetense]
MLHHPQTPVCFSFGLAGSLFSLWSFVLLYRKWDSYCDGVHGSKGIEDSAGIFRASFGVHPRIERRGGARKQSMLTMLDGTSIWGPQGRCGLVGQPKRWHTSCRRCLFLYIDANSRRRNTRNQNIIRE